MIRILASSWLLALLLATGLRAQTQPAIPPPQLTITNLPVNPPSSPAPPPPDGKIERGFAVKNAGALYLTFPKTWRDSIVRVREKDKLFDAVKFLPARGDEFAVMVEIINVGEANARKMDLKANLEKAGQLEVTNSVEQSLAIQELQGITSTGCYFTVTDKTWSAAAPKPGEYHYLTQGYAKLGGVILDFRLVSNRLPPEQQALFEMIKTARLVKK
jgi:hypothetical protein